MGRRPVVKNPPYGSCEVLSLDEPAQSPRHVLSGEPSPANGNSQTEACPTPGISVEGVLSPPTSREDKPPTSPSFVARDVLNDREVFYLFHWPYMIGPSFTDRFQAAIRAVSSHADGMLLEAYDAALNLWDIKHQRIKSLGEVDVSAGTDCLRVLQNTTTVRREDAAAIVMAGQILLVYHIVTMCTSAYSILRSALLAVRPFYDDLLSQPHLDPITITPIFLDTVESLIHREPPIIRIPTCHRFIVDRYAGLCWTLLPLLQQLCDCSARAKASGPWSPSPASDDEPDMFADLEHQIRLWEPRPPPSVFSGYTTREVNAMLLQARVYRTAALLIIHRLRHPLGTRDDEALVHANVIIAELLGFVGWAPDGMRGLPIALPLLVALLETRTSGGEDVIPEMGSFAMHPRHASEFRRFISLVWAAREGGFRGLWFDLATSFQVPIIP